MQATGQDTRNHDLTVPLRYGRRGDGRRRRVLRRGLRLDYDGEEFEQHDTLIRDGRPQADRFSLDREGFEFVRSPSAVTDFFDGDALTGVYYPEVETLIQQRTGAARVVIFDHTLRSGDERVREHRQIREPVTAVHNDYTDNSAPQRLRDLLPGEAGALLQRRFQVVQVWRAVQVPARRSPLALCDASSIADADFLPVALQYEHRVGEIYHIAWNPAQRWYYFPDMQPDEALVFKVYDSLADGRARYTPHGAFERPDAADAPARQSIEVRAMTFF